MNGRAETPHATLDQLRAEWIFTRGEPETAERNLTRRSIEAAARAVKIVRDIPTPRKPTTEPQEGTA
ncbi:MAG: hypothetical protein NVSMB4_07530 [Acidimicrobiales bacterium]